MPPDSEWFASRALPVEPMTDSYIRIIARADGVSASPDFSRYCAVYPPSTVMSWPVGNAAPGELSQSTALAISSGVPMRPTGVCVEIVFSTSVSPRLLEGEIFSLWIVAEVLVGRKSIGGYFWPRDCR